MPTTKMQQIESLLHSSFCLALQMGIDLVKNGECSPSEFQDRLGKALTKVNFLARLVSAAKAAALKQGTNSAVIEQRLVRALRSMDPSLPENFHEYFREMFYPLPMRLDWKKALSCVKADFAISTPATATIH